MGIEHDIDDSPTADELWEEWAAEHDADLDAWLDSHAPDETEAAQMAADELVEALEAMPPRSPHPTAWAADVRARIERLGLDMDVTDLSDALESAGRPRLSESTDNARYFAPLWTLTEAGRKALEAVRAERKSLLTEVTAPEVRDTMRMVRAEMGLKNKPPRQWRLRELREVAWHLRELPAVKCEQCGKPSHPVACQSCGWRHGEAA